MDPTIAAILASLLATVAGGVISYAQRQNLTMRMLMLRFTRLTNAFSKKTENHAAMVRSILHVLQLRAGASDTSRDPDDRSGRFGSRLEHRKKSSACSSKEGSRGTQPKGESQTL